MEKIMETIKRADLNPNNPYNILGINFQRFCMDFQMYNPYFEFPPGIREFIYLKLYSEMDEYPNNEMIQNYTLYTYYDF